MRNLLLVLGLLTAPPLLAGMADGSSAETTVNISGAQAQALAASCSGCHGPTTVVVKASAAGRQETLALANLSRTQLAREMLAFKAGNREATIMDRIARGYTQQEIIAIANVLGQP
jgi:sulfide dehydrogenase cytochrome subunit